MSDDEKPALKPANENPWYLLATLYGEQNPATGWLLDEKCVHENSKAWNRWMASVLTANQRELLIEIGFDESELTPFSKDENERFLEKFKARAKNKDAIPPDPNDRINFQNFRFERQVSFERFIFPRVVLFDGAHFSNITKFNKAALLKNAAFTAAELLNKASFDDATFFDNAIFHSAKFSYKGRH